MAKKTKYLLIYDTGDMVVDTIAEGMKWAKWLVRNGHKPDRIQTYGYAGSDKFKPKIVHEFKR